MNVAPALRLLPLAVLAAALAACGEKKPEMIVAAPTGAPAGGAAPAGAAADGAVPAAPPAPGGVPPAAPAGEEDGGAARPPTSGQLLAQVEALKGQLEGAPKTVEILTALGDLYYEHERFADAMGWYDQAVDAAAPVWKAYLGLPAAVRAAPASAEARARCTRGPGRGLDELSADARAHARKGDRATAAACYRAALEPAILAEVHRANAWFLAGDPRRAVAAQEAVLARVPGHPEALYFLALFLGDTAGSDLAQLRRARAMLEEVGKLDVPPPRRADVVRALEELDRRIATGGVDPGP